MDIVDASIKSITIFGETSKSPINIIVDGEIDERTTSTNSPFYRCFCSVEKEFGNSVIKIDGKRSPLYKIISAKNTDAKCSFKIFIESKGEYTISIGGNIYNKKSIRIKVD